MATEEEGGEEGAEGAEKGPIEDKDLSLLMQELQSWKTEHEKLVLSSHFSHVSAAASSSAVCLCAVSYTHLTLPTNHRV